MEPLWGCHQRIKIHHEGRINVRVVDKFSVLTKVVVRCVGFNPSSSGLFEWWPKEFCETQIRYLSSESCPVPLL